MKSHLDMKMNIMPQKIAIFFLFIVVNATLRVLAYPGSDWFEEEKRKAEEKVKKNFAKHFDGLNGLETEYDLDWRNQTSNYK